MNWTFMDAVKYIFGSFGKLSMVFDYISQAPNAVRKAISKMSQNSSHFDMTNGAIDKICTAEGTVFWLSVISSIVGIIVGLIDLVVFGGLKGGILSIIISIIGVFSIGFSALWSLIFSSLWVYIGKKYEKGWLSWVLKLFIILDLSGVMLFGIVVISDFISIVISIFTGGFVLSSITSFVFMFVTILPLFMRLDAYGDAIPINLPQGQQGFNNNQNMYNQPMDNNAGYYQNNVGFNQPNIDINKQNNVQTPQPEMFACPYCNQPITRGQNPCPYCNQMVSWPS